MLTITETLESFLQLIRDKEEGGPFSRFKSWEYCHQEFLEARESVKERDYRIGDEYVDYLALHLSFYLASWGMYRGSSFILQRDYKAHKEIVLTILKPDYEPLWDFDPTTADEEEMRDIASLAKRAYEDIEEGYGETPERCFNTSDDLSETLITKIMMGTFAITPAYDRFFVDGIRRYNLSHDDEMGTLSLYSNHDKFEQGLINLFRFVKNNVDELNTPDGVTAFNYPPMKKVDMYFWEVGYEFGFYEALEDDKEKLEDNSAANFVSTRSKIPFLKLLKQIEISLPELDQSGDTHLEIINNLMDQIIRRL